MRTGRIIFGMVGAAFAGAVIGLLVAPEKGSELRKKLSRTVADCANEINKATGELKKALAEGKETLKKMPLKKGDTAEINGKNADEAISGKA